MRVEWLTLFIILLCYSLWLMVGMFIAPKQPFVGLTLMAMLVAWHSSLTHEALHGHPTSHSISNEILVFLPLMIFFPYRRYKATHTAHHRDEILTDPFDDPESYYLTGYQYDELPSWIQTLLSINNTLLGRMTIGPVLAIVAFYRTEARLFLKNEDGVRLAWYLHVPAALTVLWAVYLMGISVWIYLVIVIWPSLSLILIRSFAEHQWHQNPQGRTIIVENSLFSLLFLNNNLHFVHHAHPGTPWYKLPRLYRDERDEWKKRNEGYVVSNYWQIWKHWAFKPKESVVHPKYRKKPSP